MDLNENPYGLDFLHEEWSYKWKWFKPPMWRIFRWAFNIKRKLYKNCYPISIGMENEYVPGHEVEAIFTTQLYRSKEIEEVAEKFRNTFSISDHYIPDDNGRRYLPPIISDKEYSFMDICKCCWYGPGGPLAYDPGTVCGNIKLCSRTYHLGHIDGVVEEGSRKEFYRGCKKYYELQTRLDLN